MPYDYRELIYREILAIDPSDIFYYSKKFNKSMFILADADKTELTNRVLGLKEDFNLSNYDLYNIEKMIRASKGIKIRFDYDIIVVHSVKVLDKLRLIDVWVDGKFQDLIKVIRFSNMESIARLRQNVV